MGSPGPSQPRVYRVSELQAAVRDLLEREVGRVWVEGEISGVKRPQSGHLYFALKGRVKELYRIGDCVAPRKIDMAIHEGYTVGRNV